MRKAVSIMVAIILVLSCASIAFAGINAINKSRSLDFVGTTAYCDAYISSSGAYCTLTVELYRGGIRVAYWYDDGVDSAAISDNVIGCASGQSYTLRVSGTVDGQPISFGPVTKICP